MNRTAWMSVITALTMVATGCDEDEEAESPLVDDTSAILTVIVVQEGEPSDTAASTEISTDSNAVVAYAEAYPDVVPLQYGEPSADPDSEFMLVTVEVDAAYADRITQVELNIVTGDGRTGTWCEPMKEDEVEVGRFYLKLQPACPPEDRDELTDLCVLRNVDGDPIESREDKLTFTLWDGTSTGECHAGDSAE